MAPLPTVAAWIAVVGGLLDMVFLIWILGRAHKR